MTALSFKAIEYLWRWVNFPVSGEIRQLLIMLVLSLVLFYLRMAVLKRKMALGVVQENIAVG